MFEIILMMSQTAAEVTCLFGLLIYTMQMI